MTIYTLRCFWICTILLMAYPLSSQNVWPGDVNNNGVVNGVDLLYLGIAYGSTGPARGEVNTNWEAIPAADGWGQSFPGGLSYAYADCNGDGVVDENDIEEAIEDNFGEVHTTVLEEEYNNGISGTDVPLELVPSIDMEDSDIVLKIGINLGKESAPVTDFYGIALKLTYDADLIAEADFKFGLTDNSWIDTEEGHNSAVVFQKEDDFGKAEVAITLTDPAQLRSGHGQIGAFSIVMEDIIVGLVLDTFNIHIDSVLLINQNIKKQAVVPDTLGFMVSAEDFAILSDIQQQELKSPEVNIFPNPNNGYFYISAESPIENIRLFNFLGQMSPIHTSNLNSKTAFLRLDHINSGTYFVTGHTSNGAFRKKVVVVR